MADDPNFLNIYGDTLPSHPIFARCEGCGDMHDRGKMVLSLAAALGEILAESIAEAQVPPELVGMVLSIACCSASLDLSSRLRSNQQARYVMDMFLSTEATVRGLIEHMPIELERLRAAAARQGAGSC